jgi:hypothetical protein
LTEIHPLVLLTVAAVAMAALWIAARRAITIAELTIEEGVVRVSRGGIAPPILADLRDIAKRPPIERGHVRIVRASGRAEVQLGGAIPAPQAQRIRNVIGSVPLARLRNAPRRK